MPGKTSTAPRLLATVPVVGAPTIRSGHESPVISASRTAEPKPEARSTPAAVARLLPLSESSAAGSVNQIDPSCWTLFFAGTPTRRSFAGKASQFGTAPAVAADDAEADAGRSDPAASA